MRRTSSARASPRPTSAPTTDSGIASCSGTRRQRCARSTPAASAPSRSRSTATDNAGNSATKTVSYRVVWPLAGLYQPIDNPPVVNTAKAGAIVPARFTLGGYRGTQVFASGFPTDAGSALPGTSRTDEIEQTLSQSASTLSYSNGVYTYAWRSQKAWASRYDLPPAHTQVPGRPAADRPVPRCADAVLGRISTYDDRKPHASCRCSSLGSVRERPRRPHPPGCRSPPSPARWCSGPRRSSPSGTSATTSPPARSPWAGCSSARPASRSSRCPAACRDRPGASGCRSW